MVCNAAPSTSTASAAKATFRPTTVASHHHTSCRYPRSSIAKVVASSLAEAASAAASTPTSGAANDDDDDDARRLDRASAAKATAGAATLALVTAACGLSGAGLGEWTALAGTALGYTAVWGGILALVLSFGGGTSANALGLGNAATPFGLKAMKELNELNAEKGTATNAMVLFLAINTSAITLLPPTGTVGVRAAAGSADPFAIWIPTLIATICSTVGAVGTVYLLRGRKLFAAKPLADTGTDAPVSDRAIETPDDAEVLGREAPPMGPVRKLLIAGFLIAVAVPLGREALDLLAEGGRDRNTAGFCLGLQPRGDVDAVAE